MAFSERKQQPTDFERFTRGACHYFSYIGIKIDTDETLFARLLQYLAIFTMLAVLLHLIGFVATTSEGFQQIAAAIGYISYYIVGLGKSLSMVHNRRALKRNNLLLHDVYPPTSVVYADKVRPYLRVYETVQFVLSKFFKYLLGLYLLLAIATSLQELWVSGKYGYKMPLPLWYPVALPSHFGVYVFYFILESLGSFYVGIIILSADLCLFNSVSQLCLHFDILAENILQLQPERPETLGKLKKIAEKHQQILSLCSHVNDVFSPSIIFSLSASSFIICFMAYQLLDDVPYIFYARAALLVLYEMKQVMITCYFGNKLMDASANICVALYMHDWYEGNPEYRRFVLYMMVHTMNPITLNVAGVADVSLITLKQVFGTSYQAFAVLKNV